MMILLSVAIALRAISSDDYERDPLFRQAAEAVGAREFDKADRLFAKLGVNPVYSARSYRSRGAVALLRGDKVSAESLFKQAYKLGDKVVLANLVTLYVQYDEKEKMRDLMPDLQAAANVSDEALSGYLIVLCCLEQRKEFLTYLRVTDEKRIITVSRNRTNLIYIYLERWGEEQDRVLLGNLRELRERGELYAPGKQ